jgi:hypothetical protein
MKFKVSKTNNYYDYNILDQYNDEETHFNKFQSILTEGQYFGSIILSNLNVRNFLE